MFFNFGPKVECSSLFEMFFTFEMLFTLKCSSLLVQKLKNIQKFFTFKVKNISKSEEHFKKVKNISKSEEHSLFGPKVKNIHFLAQK